MIETLKEWAKTGADTLSNEDYDNLRNKEIKCVVVGAIVDFKDKVVQLHYATGNCGDMEGTISYCKRLMPEVETIVTLSGGEIDTQYSLDNNEWRAFKGGWVLN